MSERKRPKDVWWLLWVTNRQLSSAARGKSGGSVGILGRLLFLWVGLGLFGGLLWHALGAMPVGLWVIVGLGLTIRVVRWYGRRLP